LRKRWIVGWNQRGCLKQRPRLARSGQEMNHKSRSSCLALRHDELLHIQGQLNNRSHYSNITGWRSKNNALGAELYCIFIALSQQKINC
jgi:hypothetical protein